MELTLVAVANQTTLVRGDAVTPAEARDLISYADAYGPVADELEALAQFIRHSVKSARNRAGSDALTTYALAQRLPTLLLRLRFPQPHAHPRHLREKCGL